MLGSYIILPCVVCTGVCVHVCVSLFIYITAVCIACQASTTYTPSYPHDMYMYAIYLHVHVVNTHNMVQITVHL